MKFGFESVETDTSYIGSNRSEGSGIREGDRIDEVVCDFIVIVKDQSDAVIIESGIKTKVELGSRLPSQRGILHRRRKKGVVARV